MPAFTSATATAAAAKSHASRQGRGELKQALVLQDLAYKAALAISPALSPLEKLSRDDAVALASLLKSWDTLCNRVRILRDKPLPGSRRPPLESPKRQPKKYPNLPPSLPVIPTPT